MTKISWSYDSYLHFMSEKSPFSSTSLGLPFSSLLFFPFIFFQLSSFFDPPFPGNDFKSKCYLLIFFLVLPISLYFLFQVFFICLQGDVSFKLPPNLWEINVNLHNGCNKQTSLLDDVPFLKYLHSPPLKYIFSF